MPCIVNALTISFCPIIHAFDEEIWAVNFAIVRLKVSFLCRKNCCKITMSVFTKSKNSVPHTFCKISTHFLIQSYAAAEI